MNNRPISQDTGRTFVQYITDVAQNLQKLEEYLHNSTPTNREKAIDLVRRGRNLICYRINDEFHFAPSRWCGYYRNNFKTHSENHGDGTETTPLLNKIIHRNFANNETKEARLATYDLLESRYQDYCKQLGVEPQNVARRYWDFDLDSFIEDNDYVEGAKSIRKHNAYDRNPKLIEAAKRKAKKANNGKLICEVCGFDFAEAYGEIGEDFIEGHHIIPLSEIGTQYTATVDDIAMVCANCHRMLHRGEGRSIEELKKNFNSN